MRNIGNSREFVRPTLSMPKTIWEALVVTARRHHMKPSQLLTEAIRRHLVTQYGHPDIWAEHWHQFIENEEHLEVWTDDPSRYTSKGPIEDLGL